MDYLVLISATLVTEGLAEWCIHLGVNYFTITAPRRILSGLGEDNSSSTLFFFSLLCMTLHNTDTSCIVNLRRVQPVYKVAKCVNFKFSICNYR